MAKLCYKKGGHTRCADRPRIMQPYFLAVHAGAGYHAPRHERAYKTGGAPPQAVPQRGYSLNTPWSVSEAVMLATPHGLARDRCHHQLVYALTRERAANRLGVPSQDVCCNVPAHP